MLIIDMSCRSTPKYSHNSSSTRLSRQFSDRGVASPKPGCHAAKSYVAVRGQSLTSYTVSQNGRLASPRTGSSVIDEQGPFLGMVELEKASAALCRHLVPQLIA